MKKKKEVVEMTLVAPSEEMRRQELWLSNLDLKFPHIYTRVISYYPAAAAAAQQGGGACEGFTFFDPDRLRVALAKALVPFYPLAGRLSLSVGEDDGRRRRHIDCNGEGVRFVVVRADVTGAEFFQDYQPSPEVTDMFVPALPPDDELPCMVALFQVTFLKCGGVVLTSCFHHSIVDATGIFHFMQTWSRLARGGMDAADAVGPEPPFHDRTSLRARSPPVPPPANAPDTVVFTDGGRPRAFATRSYPLPLKLIDDLKSRCGSASTFSAVTAHIWRCACVARRLAPDSDTRLGMAVNVRRRLRPPLPHGFFGNAVLRVFTTARVGDVVVGGGSSPAAVVGMVRDAVNSVDDAYARAMVDYHEVEVNSKPTTTVTKPVARAAPAESNVAVISWLWMPLYDADFGWGTPQLVTPVVRIFGGMVFLLPRGSDKESGVTVLVTLEPDYLPAFHKLLHDVV